MKFTLKTQLTRKEKLQFRLPVISLLKKHDTEIQNSIANNVQATDNVITNDITEQNTACQRKWQQHAISFPDKKTKNAKVLR